MLKKIKFFFILFVGLLFIMVGFYFWASSSNLSPLTYNKWGQYDDPKPVKNDSIHSIITYNIGYLSGMTNNLPVEKPKSLFDQNLKKVIAHLKAINPDIIALQEIDYGSERSFYIDQETALGQIGYNYFGRNINWDKKYLPFPYYPISLHFGKVLSGQSILSKYPIIEQERIALKRNLKNLFFYDSFYLDRLAQVTKIKLNDNTLVLINVHLEAYDQETRKIQMQQVKNIYIKYYKQYPTILLGDFNSDINFANAGIKLFLDLSHTGCAAYDPNISDNTFSSASPTERLDYIFYNENFIQEVDAKILEEFDTASDHLPLLMNFKFKNQFYANLRRQPNP